MRYFIVFGLIIGVMTLSCEEDGLPEFPPSIGIPDLIELRAQYYDLRGYSGEVRRDTIIAIFRDISNVAKPNVGLTFSLINPDSWKGSVHQLDDFTDSSGSGRAVYEVSFSQTGQVVIEARAENARGRITISLDLIEDSDRSSLKLIGVENELILPHDSSAAVSFYASLFNPLDSVGYSNVLVNFTLTGRAGGDLSRPFAVTDQRGRAHNTFQTEPNAYGTYEIRANTFRDSAFAEIVIREP